MPYMLRHGLASRLRDYMRDENAVTTIEYGLIVMIMLGIVVVFTQDISAQQFWLVFNDIGDGLQNSIETSTGG